jgi:hypothetical protein
MTYAEAIATAGHALAAARARRDSLTPAAAAAEAVGPGDDIHALTRTIAAQRVQTRAA